MTTEGTFLQAGPHCVRLKWHRAQRHANDTPFTLARLCQGFALGAVMEVDVRLSADGGCVCLHDVTLDRETTGSGPVAAVSTEMLRGLRMRDPEGKPTTDPLLMLDALAEMAACSHGDARLQLDLKERLARIDISTADRFAAALAGSAKTFTLSGHDWEAVKRLGAGAPGIQLGFDPCDRPEVGALRWATDFAAFVDMTLSAAPEATIIYLQHRIVLAGLAAGYDMIGAFHAQGRQVDAWTLKIDQPGLARDLVRLVAARVDQITTGEPIELERLWIAISGTPR